MAKFGKQHLDLLIAQMLRSLPLTDLAISKLEGSHLTTSRAGGSVAHGVLFSVIKQFVTAFKHLPDDAALFAEIDVYLSRYVSDAARRVEINAAIAAVLQMRSVADARSEGVARRVVSEIVASELVVPATSQLLVDAQMTGSYTGLADKLRELEAQQQSVDGGKSFSDVLSLDMSDRGQRAPTHIPWLDAKLGKGRGPVLGCGIGILAPQGAGKTTMGLSMCVAQALAGQHTLLTLAEGGYDQSIKNKIIGCTLGIDYTLLEQMTLEKALAATKSNTQLAAKRLELIKKHLHVLDLAKLGGGIESVVAEIATLCASGKQPTYTYVDWAGIMAARDDLVASGKRQMEAALKHISYTAADAAAKYNVMIAVSQQMAADAVKKGPAAMNDQYCAAHCRGWTEPFKYVFVINPPHPVNRTSVFGIPKARDDPPQDRFVVRLHGDIASFRDVTSDYECTNGKVRPRKTAGGATVS